MVHMNEHEGGAAEGEDEEMESVSDGEEDEEDDESEDERPNGVNDSQPNSLDMRTVAQEIYKIYTQKLEENRKCK